MLLTDCRLLMGNTGGKRPLVRPRCRLEIDVKIDLKEIDWEGVDWIDLAEYRDKWRALENAGINI